MEKQVVFQLYPSHPGTVATTICHGRASSVAEIRGLANNGPCFSLARYRGALYSICPDREPPFLTLSNGTEAYHHVKAGELDAVFAACFEICYQGRWYPCDVFGMTPDGQVCVIADDPMNTSGLATHHTRYMWGGGVEFQELQIEAVRLWTSDPIDPTLLDKS